MIARAGILLLLLFPPTLPFPSAVTAQESNEALFASAEAWIRLLDAGEFGQAAARVSPTVRDRLNSDRLGSIWGQITAGTGSLQSLTRSRIGEEQGTRYADFGGVFREGRFTVRVAMNPAGECLGFAVLPATTRSDGSDPVPAELVTAAEGWVALLQAGNYGVAAQRISPVARSQLTAEAIQGAWSAALGQTGELQGVDHGSYAPEQGLHAVLIPGRFQRGAFNIQVVLDGEGGVAGFFVRP